MSCDHGWVSDKSTKEVVSKNKTSHAATNCEQSMINSETSGPGMKEEEIPKEGGAFALKSALMQKNFFMDFSTFLSKGGAQQKKAKDDKCLER